MPPSVLSFLPVFIILVCHFACTSADDLKPKSCGSAQFDTSNFFLCNLVPTVGSTQRWWEVDEFTVEFWIKPKIVMQTVGVMSSLGTVVLPSGYRSGWAMAISAPCNIDFMTSQTPNKDPTMSLKLLPGQWQQVSGTYSKAGGGFASLTVTPQSDISTIVSKVNRTGLIEWTSPSPALYIGRLGLPAAFPSSNFMGQLDEIRLWSKALDPVTLKNQVVMTEFGASPNLLISFPIKTHCDFKDKSGNKRECTTVLPAGTDYAHNFVDDCSPDLTGYGPMIPDESNCPSYIDQCVFTEWSEWGLCQEQCTCGKATCPSQQTRTREVLLPLGVQYKDCPPVYNWEVGCCRFDNYKASKPTLPSPAPVGEAMVKFCREACLADSSCVSFDTGANNAQCYKFSDPSANTDFLGGTNWKMNQCTGHAGLCWRKTLPLNYTRPCTSICTQDCVWGAFGEFSECTAPPAEQPTANTNAVTIHPTPEGISCADVFYFPNFMELVMDGPCINVWTVADNTIDQLQKKYGVSEGSLAPKPGDTLGGFTWNIVDRNQVSRIIDGCKLAYYTFAVYAAEDTTLTPLFQHDDEGVIYLDGLPVVNIGGWNSAPAGVTPASWYLTAGWHQVVIRVHNQGGLGSMKFGFSKCSTTVTTLPYVPWNRTVGLTTSRFESVRSGLAPASDLDFWTDKMSIAISFRSMAALTPGTAELPIFRYGTSPAARFEIRASATQMVVEFFGEGDNSAGMCKGGPIGTNVVHQVAVIKDGTQFNIFMDGATLCQTLTYDKKPTGKLDIGYNTLTKASWEGDLDDILIVSKVVPACELFGAAGALLTNVYAKWNFETLNTVDYTYADASGNGHHLSVFGQFVQPTGVGLPMVAWNGAGVQTRRRLQTQDVKGSGKPCTGSNEENKPCTAPNDCLVPCELSEWSAYGTCSVPCDDGVQIRNRTITRQPAGGAPPCDALSEQQPCNLGECPPDCLLGPFTNSTDCSKPCGGGTMVWERQVGCSNCAVGTANQKCGESSQVRTCNEQDCEQDCELSTWGPWSTCSQECGYGVKTMFRTIVTVPTPGGLQCAALTMSQGCKEKDCPPAECIFGDWEAVSNCSTKCDGGQMDWHRSAQPSRWTLKVLYQEEETKDGPTSVPADVTHEPEVVGFVVGTLGPISLTGDSTTPVEFGEDVRSTADVMASLPPGTLADDAFATVTFDGQHTNPIVFMGPTTHNDGDAVTIRIQNVQASGFEWQLDEWEGSDQDHTSESVFWLAVDSGRHVFADGGVMEAGSVSVGDITTKWTTVTFQQPLTVTPIVLAQVVTRNDKRTVVTRLRNVSPTGFDVVLTGSEAAAMAHSSETVHWIAVSPGDHLISGSTHILAQITPESVDENVYNQDFDFPTDKLIGMVAQVQTSVEMDPGSLRFEPTVGEVSCPDGNEKRDCNMQECDVDCVMGDWSVPTPCTVQCGGGVETSTRVVVTQPRGLGAQCNATTKDEPCNLEACPPICSFTPWVNGTCSLPCGSGVIIQTRTVTCVNCLPGLQEATCGPQDQQLSCNETPCPVDCKVSDWGGYTPCSKDCGSGTRNRTRSIMSPSQYGGAECPTDLEQVEVCEVTPCPVDCLLSSWSDWSNCSVPCSVGVRNRSRTILTEPANGGSACQTLTESEDCYMDPCPPECDVGLWAPGNCSVACGGGQMVSTRPVSCTNCKPEEVISKCGNDTMVETCNIQQCPVDCLLSPWGAWGTCSQPCGDGTQIQERTVLTYPQGTGKPCDTTLSQSQPCNVAACPPQCSVGDWVAAGDCSATCGGGTQTYDRKVTGGSTCGLATESRPCNTQPCDVDCKVTEWTDWSACDAPCGQGSQWRTLQILAQTIGNGKPCPTETRQTQTCTLKECDPECQVTDWVADGKGCSKPCGGGLLTSVRSVVGDPVTCGKSVMTEPCNTQPCDMTCQYSEWGAWSTCSTTCGPGTKTSKRTVLIVATGASPPCEDSLVQSADCNNGECKQECTLGPWVVSGTCSAPCGGGVQYYTRTVTASSSGKIDVAECGATTDSKPCNTQACTTDPCVVTDWSVWTECSALCGGGTMTRFRSISKNGAMCPDPSELTSTLPCNEQACQVNGDTGSSCEVAWSPWNESMCFPSAASTNSSGEASCPPMTRVAIKQSGTCKPEELISERQCNVSSCVLAAASTPGLPAIPWLVTLLGMLVACALFLLTIGLLHLRRVKDNSAILDYSKLGKKGSEYNPLTTLDDELDEM